ncbi:NifU family protein [Bdellovibrionota bacterium]
MTEEQNVSLEERVKGVLEEIRPFLQQDGGDLEFIKMDGKRVIIRLQGACQGCPSALITLKMGIERRIQEEIPEVEGVDAV